MGNPFTAIEKAVVSGFTSVFTHIRDGIKSRVAQDVRNIDPAQVVKTATDLAGGFILTVEKNPGMSGQDKLFTAAGMVVDYFAAKAIPFLLHEAVAIVAGEFVKLDASLRAQGRPPLVNGTLPAPATEADKSPAAAGN